MLRVVPTSSAARAKSYFSRSDYYSEGQELDGVWQGKGADRLGLAGLVGKDDFDALCDNRHPATGERLTACHRANRTVGYDFNFHAPKSLSLLHALTDDSRLLGAFQDAVDDTMRRIEADMQTRVRKGYRYQDRTTGEMVWARFDHLTARPVDGVPDPHLHSHCFVVNATYDSGEQEWKAGPFRDLKRDAPYYRAVSCFDELIRPKDSPTHGRMRLQVMRAMRRIGGGHRLWHKFSAARRHLDEGKNGPAD